MGKRENYNMFYLNKMAKEADSVIGEERRKEIMGCCEELTRTKPRWHRAKTMKSLMVTMEEKTTTEELIQIRERCACKPAKFLTEIRKIKKEFTGLEERISAAAKTNFAGKCVITGEGEYLIEFNLKECVCGMITGRKNVVPLSWCHCCKGHVQWLYENLLDKRFNMELISSVAAGGEDCVFRMREVKPQDI